MTAIERGVTFLDTGDEYGDAEVLIGGLRPTLKDKLKIATKAGLRKDGVRDFTEAYLLNQIDRSLKRLKIDCIDLFQLNKPGVKDLEDGTLLEFLAKLKRSGKVKHAGIV